MLLETFFPPNKTFFIWDAIVQWRDKIFLSEFYNDTKGNYISGILKLIEENILDFKLPLKSVNDEWLKEVKRKIDCHPNWSQSTKTIRKSCLNSFYRFTTKEFNHSVKPYQRHPPLNEIKHILSNVQDKTLTKNISPEALCNAMSKRNLRDAYIVWLMMHTGETLESILAISKNKEAYTPPYIKFNLDTKSIPKHITDAIDELSKNSKTYLFETSSGKKIGRSQIIRNLKKAGHEIGLEFDLTPKLLHAYVCAYISRDKRSEIEKVLSTRNN